MTTPRIPTQWRLWLIAATALVTLATALLLDPIRQDPAYHNFADQRTLLGIPNFANVISNLPFLIVGLLGLLCTGRQINSSRSSRTAWNLFFAGVALVSIGSAYYHLTPNNDTLFWDRAPMAIAFMALVVAVLGEHKETSMTSHWLLPAIALGIGSVLWWRYTDDLRFYGWVQFGSLAVVALVVGLCTPQYTHRTYLGYGLALYALAKAAEFYDVALYRWIGDISGHSIKHLLAAAAPFAILLMLRRRNQINS